MAGNDQKTPLGRSLNRLATMRALDAIQLTGRSLPCHVVRRSGAIVVVAFDITGPATLPQCTMPIGSAEYVRLPLQPGCKGLAVAATARLGGQSGLGSGPAPLVSPPNLTALVFFPTGNTAFPGVSDLNALVLYGEPNVVAQDKTGASVVTIATAGITLASHGHTLVISSAGITLDGILFASHEHSGVSTGTGITGPVVT
jgi:hypothetical protein